jgi:hypothetical protein
MKRTSVVEHNLYFARARDRGINKWSKHKGLIKTKLIIIIILHIIHTIITTVSILNLKAKTIAPINVAHIKCRKSNTEIYTNICSWEKSGGFKKSLLLLKTRRI